jgi:hypothetical protein
MFFFLVAGNKRVSKDAGSTEQAIQCPNCGTVARFGRRTERQYLTLFFVLPVVPLGGANTVVECPTCHARFDAPAQQGRAA